MTEKAGLTWAKKAMGVAIKIRDSGDNLSPLEEDEEDLEISEMIAEIAPYNSLSNYELLKQESLEYLNKMLPNMSGKDKARVAPSYIYKCVACHRYYPTWWISKKDWQDSFPGRIQAYIELWENRFDAAFKAENPEVDLEDIHEEFNDIYLCKECFEEIGAETASDPPKYFTINQYIVHRLAAINQTKYTEEKKSELRRLLSQIWDLPAAYHTAEHPASTAQDSR